MSLAAAQTHSTVSEAEWETRVDLAACYRLIARLGMDDLIYNHISARVPGPEEHFLLNPFGLMYEEITASSLVKVDLDGNIVGDSEYPINPAGFVIHSCIHRERPEMHCVLHTHTVAGTAVASQEEGLLPLNQTSMIYHGLIRYHDYEGLALDTDEQQRLLADMGDGQILILRNHGLLTAGRTIPEAFQLMYYTEEACRMQIAAQSGGAKLRVPPKEVAEKTFRQAMTGLGAEIGSREFAALKRKLDREDASYRN